MRKYHQKQLLELMNTLGEAHTEIRRLFSEEKIEVVLALLTDCQTCAIEIGRSIERLEGEGTKTVAYLEEYCDLLYRIALALTEAAELPKDVKLFKPLEKQRLKIENSIRIDLKPNKLEILFLPYKASMWDAMESIWLKAKDDPQCEAVVMPIPYYDRLPDGTLGKMHYEGNEYPGNVPVADWQKYNIEERRPDIIVTHSPYDEGNYVTTIHPDFYSKRLKDLTDLLVYVPYFVCVDDVKTHFCVCAGTLYADMVIVQSEKIRQTYIREFRKFEKERGCQGRFGKAESKFVALGSPKFDKVIGTKREDCEIPAAWLKLMEKPDGTRKKTVLYNTTIETLLLGKEEVLCKLRDVFACFKGRDDVVLLWRPHPLNEATYQAMRPQLLNEYVNIVADYRRQGWGIYDDTADLHRAIAISDAYYGDWSSLIALCQAAGKPVMIQNLHATKENEYYHHLAFENLYDDGTNLWFTAYNFNALFKMDKQTWRAEYVGSFPGEKPDGWRLYASITEHGGKLYFAPLFAEEIAEYDLRNGVMKKIQLELPEPLTKTPAMAEAKFYAAVSYKNWVYFVANRYPAFLRYDTTDGKIDYFTDWVKPLHKLGSDQTSPYFKEVCVTGSRFVAAAANTNAVVVFDMDTCTSAVYEVGDKSYQYIGVCFDGNDYWLAPRHHGPVVRWNPDTKEYKEYHDFPEGFTSDYYYFWGVAYAGGYIWLFPNLANMALKVDAKEGKITAAAAFQPECEQEKTGRELLPHNYILAKATGDILYAHTGRTNRLIEYNCKTGHLREEPIRLSTESLQAMEAIRSQAFRKDPAACKSEFDCYFYESALPTLPDFLDYISRHGGSEEAKSLQNRQIELFRETNKQADGTSGQAIYALLKQTTLG